MATAALPAHQQEQQLTEALRQLMPPEAWLLIVGYQTGPAGPGTSAGVYLTRPVAGEWAAGSLPDLPAALTKRFEALLAAQGREYNGAIAWDACRFRLSTDVGYAYRYNFEPRVDYGCRAAPGSSASAADSDAAYELPTPAELLAHVQRRDEELDQARRRDPLQMERVLLAALLPALPADCHQALVRYEAAPEAAAGRLRGIYLTLGGDEARALPLPVLPAAVATGFADFRRASIFQSGEEWAGVEAWVRMVEDGYGGEELAVSYFFDPPRPLRGLLDEAAPASESPAEFAARVRAELAEAPEESYDAAGADYAEAPPRAAPRQAAAPTTWVCTWCHAEYASARQPTSFQPGKCPRNPGRAHAWHR